MKIAHYLRKLHLTGGTKVIAQHQKIMRSLGHEVFWFVREVSTDFDFELPITVINEVSEISSYEVDVLIANKPKDYWEIKPVKCGRLVYLSQAFEVDHMNLRCEKKKREANNFLLRFALDFKWWFKKRRVHKMYEEKPETWCVSPYLIEVLKPYGCPTMLVRNSFDDSLYNLTEKKQNPLPIILSVGDFKLSRKNVPFLFDALKSVKKEFYLIRVSPDSISDEEKESGLVDEFYSRIPEEQLAELYRKADILVSTSIDEGFGLPALEAMACGALCVLSDIGAYRGFADIADDAPENYALFFNPYKLDELVKSIDEALSCSEQHEVIRANGIKLASYYSKDKTIKDLECALKGF